MGNIAASKRLIPLSPKQGAIDEPKQSAPAGGTLGLWNLGFRPFYLLASLFAAVSIGLWALQYVGVLPILYVPNAATHGSEMLFGYTTAVVAGFLLTAVRNWTGQPTPHGGMLAALALLWLAGRVAVVTPWTLTAALVNGAFPLVVAATLAVPLLRARNRRNYFFLALLGALGLLAMALSLAHFDIVGWPARADLQVGLDVVLFIMVVMGGRVIPMFTNNGVMGSRARRVPALERCALGGVLLLLIGDLLRAPPLAIAALCALLALVHGGRLSLWQPWRTLRTPLVWILHAAYAWIVVYFALRALAALGLVSAFIAIHALTIGAIGGLTIGMMTRTARGHTGRALVASGADVACYALVMIAALVRVAGPVAWPDGYVATVELAAACWAVAFVVYFISYAPSLLRARIDGKPG